MDLIEWCRTLKAISGWTDGWMDGWKSPGGPRYRAPTVLIRIYSHHCIGIKSTEATGKRKSRERKKGKVGFPQAMRTCAVDCPRFN